MLVDFDEYRGAELDWVRRVVEYVHSGRAAADVGGALEHGDIDSVVGGVGVFAQIIGAGGTPGSGTCKCKLAACRSRLMDSTDYGHPFRRVFCPIERLLVNCIAEREK